MISAEEARKLAEGDINLEKVLYIISTRINEEAKNFNYSTTIVEEPFYIWASVPDVELKNGVANTVMNTLRDQGYNATFVGSPKGLEISWKKTS